jgi:hypothetical protein
MAEWLSGGLLMVGMAYSPVGGAPAETAACLLAMEKAIGGPPTTGIVVIIHPCHSGNRVEAFGPRIETFGPRVETLGYVAVCQIFSS